MRNGMRMLSALLALMFLVQCPVSAHHGSGGGGGLGAATQEAVTTPKKTWRIDFTFNYTTLENWSRADIEAEALAAYPESEVDGIDSHTEIDVDITYGLFDSLDVGLRFGAARMRGLQDAEANAHGHLHYHDQGNPEGLKDAWVHAKWNFWTGAKDALALYGAVKLPVGKDDELGDQHGAVLAPGRQPGNKGFEAQWGAAWTHAWSERLQSHASVEWVHRWEHGWEHMNYKLGDTLDGGAMLSYRLWHPSDEADHGHCECCAEGEEVLCGHVERGLSVLAEARVRKQWRNELDGYGLENSGGVSVIGGLGLRMDWNEHVSTTVLGRIPLMQNLNERQQETQGQVLVTVSFRF